MSKEYFYNLGFNAVEGVRLEVLLEREFIRCCENVNLCRGTYDDAADFWESEALQCRDLLDRLREASRIV